jgi:hypothetical protein
MELYIEDISNENDIIYIATNGNDINGTNESFHYENKSLNNLMSDIKEDANNEAHFGTLWIYEAHLIRKIEE